VKILQVTQSFVPSNFGQVRLFYNFSKSLTEKGHEVMIYTTDVDIGHSPLSNTHGTKNVDGINVRYFRNLSNTLASRYRAFLPLGITSAARKQLRTFDIIHLHNLRTFQNIVIHHYAVKYDIPYVLQTHGSLPRVAAGETGLRWLLRWLFDVTFGNRILKNATRVIAGNEFGVREYMGVGIDNEKIALIPYFFPIEDYSQLPPPGQFRNQYGIGNKKVVMFLGRIHRIKGLDFLIESFHELSCSEEDVILAIVGPDDGYKHELERLISKLNLSTRVLFTGFLGGQDKLAALVDADVMVQPSRYEQAAWAPIEAVLCGTPVIVSKDSGAGADVRRMDAGYLAEQGNKRELIEVIQEIINDPSEARAKARRAGEYIRANLPLTERVADYERLYMESIEENRSSRS